MPAPPSLHGRLIEHLNAEIVLGSITTLDDAIRWLRVGHTATAIRAGGPLSLELIRPRQHVPRVRHLPQSSFLYVRMCANPAHYNVRMPAALVDYAAKARIVDDHLRCT